jgi:hypothetical protein
MSDEKISLELLGSRVLTLTDRVHDLELERAEAASIAVNRSCGSRASTVRVSTREPKQFE